MKFFIVVRNNTQLSAQKRYDTYEEARIEAERLSNKERAKFHILGCVGTVDVEQASIKTVWQYEAPQTFARTGEGQGHQEDITGALRGVGAQVARSGIGSQAQEKD